MLVMHTDAGFAPVSSIAHMVTLDCDTMGIAGGRRFLQYEATSRLPFDTVVDVGERDYLTLRESLRCLFRETVAPALHGRLKDNRDCRAVRTGERFSMMTSERLRTAGAPPNIVIPLGSDRRPLPAHVVLVRGLGLDMLPGARLALLVTDLGRNGTADPTDLDALFQLSSSEAEVAVLIARGFTVREIADRRGVADETVRVQIKNLFRKMDANRQGGVVRLVDRVTRLPLSTAQPED